MLRGLLSRSPIDGFVLAILAAVVVAAIFPARGAGAHIVDVLVVVAIVALFFLYGARLHPRDALAGVTHWRLHVTILAFTFIVFPCIGAALRPITEPLIGHDLYTGLLYLTLVPSTVQSSIAFTSIARGNIAGAIVSASASNLLGVLLTPVLVVLLMPGTSGVHITASSVVAIVLEILVPFIAGQLCRPVISPLLKRYAEPTKLVDRGSIILVVYSAFSEGVRNGIWSLVRPWQVVAVAVIALLLVIVMLVVTRAAGRRLGFNRGDVIAIQFCGTKKSLATGLPMATVLFSGPVVGLIVLPLMIFHQLQLILCSWLASRYAQDTDAAPTAT
ncbi:MAG: bile acid:sodium symporter family protein [Gordonia sp. (in: high G+C Gram-positive bacteria)]